MTTVSGTDDGYLAAFAKVARTALGTNRSVLRVSATTRLSGSSTCAPWGNEATIHLQAEDLKDIRTFNPGEGGGELILQKNALLHITKVNPQTKEVWAEQVG